MEKHKESVFMRRIKKITIGVVILQLLLTMEVSAEQKLSEGVISYKITKDKRSIYGTLNCRGSTNVGRLLKKWVPNFIKKYPDVQSNLLFKGSSDGFRSLISEEANIGASSRKIKETEIEAFKKVKGYAPTEIKVSFDALAIYVNRLNKLEHITLDKLDAIFSEQHKRGYIPNINSWKELTGIDKKINIYLFDKNSGARSYFKHKVMLGANYNNTTVVSDKYINTSEVINQVAKDKYGICFASIGIKNFKVKALSLSKREHYPTYSPSLKDTKNRTYPLTRFFYIYLDVPPDKPIPKLFYEFCKFILSYEGQSIVMRAGGLPLSPKQIGIELSKMRRD